jgi:hypothetical protein
VKHKQGDNKMDLMLMKKKIESARKWAIETRNTQTGLDYRMLFKMITHKEPEGDDWENRKENANYSIAAYAYGAYAFKNLNNWDNYKKWPNANPDFLKMLKYVSAKKRAYRVKGDKK